jgi:hypothetical protein
MKYAYITTAILLAVGLALLPVATLALEERAAPTVRVIVSPLPPGRELLLILTPCSALRPAALSVWVGADRKNGFRTFSLKNWRAGRMLLGRNWLNRLVGRFSLPNRC